MFISRNDGAGKFFDTCQRSLADTTWESMNSRFVSTLFFLSIFHFFFFFFFDELVKNSSLFPLRNHLTRVICHVNTVWILSRWLLTRGIYLFFYIYNCSIFVISNAQHAILSFIFSLIYSWYKCFKNSSFKINRRITSSRMQTSYFNFSDNINDAKPAKINQILSEN